MTFQNDNCAILADSINLSGDRLTSILFKRFPYCLIQEMGTHRLNVASAISPFFQDMSRNSASTRAIPLSKLIEKVEEDPFIPTFELEKRGMSGLVLTDADRIEIIKSQWLVDLTHAIEQVKFYQEQGIHKSKPAKLLIPWLRIPIIVTSTDWGHFFDLRCDESADVDFREQAQAACNLFLANTPRVLHPGEWHIPFSWDVPFTWESGDVSLKTQLMASAANIARVSYFNFEGKTCLASNLELADKLISSQHMSPFEHLARAENNSNRIRNFSGFTQYRVILEDGVVDF